MTGLAVRTPLAELRDAFALAASLPGWATGMCAAVEAEIRTGELGLAVREWVISSAGLTRLVLTFALRDAKPGPADTAVAALGWIFVRNMIRALRPISLAPLRLGGCHLAAVRRPRLRRILN